ncbi:MAG: hypothetical protein IPI67_13760 [Myxococcales bacterium]|nr:hypothetical protein [Myxococcales bacterium]
MTPLPRFTALAAHVKPADHGVSFAVPARHWAFRGILLALALPPLFALLAVLAGLDEDGVSVPSVVLAGIAGLSFVLGLLLALVSPLLAARTRTRIDFGRGFVFTARSPYPVSLSAFTQLEVERQDRVSGFLELRAHRTDGPALKLLGPLLPKHATEAAELAHWLGATLNVPVSTPALPSVGAASSSSDSLAGLLCYLPIQGVFIIASLYYLFAARGRPFVRFCAIQSLSQLGFSIATLAIILLGLGVPLALADPSPLQTALIVLLAITLTLYWLWNFAAHAYACYSAYKGRLWVMPWLGFWVRRFLPPT